MKKQYGVSILVISLLALAGCATTTPSTTEPVKVTTPVVTTTTVVTPAVPEDTSIKVGSSVAAKWTDGQWYGATITNVNAASYDVKYDDGSSGVALSKDSVKYAMLKPDLNVGDKVFAVWQTGGKFYSGSVAEVKTDGATIKWDDGSTPSFVLFGKITKDVLESTGTLTTTPVAEITSVVATPSATTAFKVGDQVAAEWATGSWWYATIKSISGGNYAVDYSDGTSGTLTADKLIALDKKLKLVANDKVKALWGGKFYPGTVTEVKTGGATIKWDDGTAPSFVELGKIYK